MVVITEVSEGKFIDNEFIILSGKKKKAGSPHSKGKEYIIHTGVCLKEKLTVFLVLFVHSFIYSFAEFSFFFF